MSRSESRSESRYPVAFDTETWLIKPGLLAPPPVCGTFFDDNDGFEGAKLLLADDAMDYVEELLDNPDVDIVGQNVAFDFGVVVHARPHLLPKVFAAYDAGRVRDIRIRDKLLLLAKGEMKTDGKPTGFSMADIVLRRFGVDLSEDKKSPDAWRLRYSELDGVPLEEWPAEAARYAKDDAVWTLKAYLDQEREAGPLAYSDEHLGDLDTGLLLDEARQTRAAFALHLMGMWGVRTDGDAVRALEATLGEHVETANEKLAKAGLLKQKKVKNKETGLHDIEWSKDTKVIQAKVTAAFEGQGRPVPLTETGRVKMDEETLRESGDPDLLILAESAGDAKLFTTYIPVIQKGADVPICPGWNELVESGRTSCRNPNLQNPPRKGGVRECFVPRPGFWYLSADYSTLELCTWSQVCLDVLGYSDMADAIRDDVDLHVAMGTEILLAEGKDVTYEEVNAARKAGEKWAKDARQLAKAANFGLPGGLGAETFVAYAWASYGVRIDIGASVRIKQAWLRRWREAQAYFDLISSASPYGGEFRIRQLRSHRVRGGCRFTTGANSFFQGLAADGAKEALWRITKACYLPSDSALYGCRPVAFLHDEFILEVPADPDWAHAAHLELLRHMVEGMKVFVPDVPIKAEPSLMERWYKEAEPAYDERGRLTLWRPKEKKA